MVAGVLALDHVEEGVLEFLGDGAGVTRTDDAGVHFPDGGDLRGGAGEKGLVGQVELIPGEDAPPSPSSPGPGPAVMMLSRVIPAGLDVNGGVLAASRP